MKLPHAAVTLLALSLMTTVTGNAQGPEPVAPLLLTNGRIWTNDPDRPEAQAMLIRDGRIVWVGNDDEIPAEVGPPTVRVDLRGHRVIPGFNDAHTHVLWAGQGLLSPNLLDSESADHFAVGLGQFASSQPKGRWVRGANWDHERWSDPTLPSKWLIDPLTRENPVLLNRTDGHIALANSVALEIAGITSDTPDPIGGEIDRDPETGEATGILRDAAITLVSRHIPDPSVEELNGWFVAAMGHAARHGVTTVQDMCTDFSEYVDIYRVLAAEGRLTLRVFCRTRLSGWQSVSLAGVHAGSGDEWVREGSLKAYADGALGSSTAYFNEPYTDDPSNRGLLDAVMQPPEKFYELTAGADGARLQLSIHAIGDAAISLVLDQFEKIDHANEDWDRRWRIEHAQHMDAADFARMADLGVIASVQPYHAIDDGRWAERKIGPERAQTTYAFRSFQNAGVRQAFGTDWPVAPLNPMLTVYAAVTRRTFDGVHPDGWVPAEKMTVEDALVAYTSGSAYAEFMEHEKGRLKEGFLADVVVLSDDPFEVESDRLVDILPVMTLVGGRSVYADREWMEAGRE